MAVAKQLEKAIRLTDRNTAQEIMRQMGHVPTNNAEYELFSLRHDVWTGNHDRDYRCFYLPTSDYLRDSGRALRISDVISGPGRTAPLQINVFAVQDHDYAGYSDMIAYGKHMLWLQPTGETARSVWGKWESRMNNHIRCFSSVHWGDVFP